MKKILTLVILVTAALYVHAQQPSPESDTTNAPNRQTDPELKQIPEDIHYIDERVRITADELPPVVLDSLKAAEPTGWEKSVVYKDKRNQFYIVEVRESGQERLYRFDHNGARIKNLDERSNNRHLNHEKQNHKKER